jgi:hypothetical protein
MKQALYYVPASPYLESHLAVPPDTIEYLSTWAIGRHVPCVRYTWKQVLMHNAHIISGSLRKPSKENILA